MPSALTTDSEVYIVPVLGSLADTLQVVRHGNTHVYRITVPRSDGGRMVFDGKAARVPKGISDGVFKPRQGNIRSLVPPQTPLRSPAQFARVGFGYGFLVLLPVLYILATEQAKEEQAKGFIEIRETDTEFQLLTQLERKRMEDMGIIISTLAVGLAVSELVKRKVQAKRKPKTREGRVRIHGWSRAGH